MMQTTFYFYDLETTGFNSRQARIMQFAGQRTDKNLKPIGQPDNLLVKLTDDILPEPDAVLVHGISPRLTQTQGITEAELCEYLTSKVFTPGTIAVGFNNIRFDDEFIRHLFWRNFYDAYEWQWKDGRSKWDLLDASRMVRALRPEGINWPFASDGSPSNKLELLSSVNKISHETVHDALSDVNAMIAFAQLIHAKQPDLFSYMLKMRDKKAVEELVASGDPFVYVSGRYPSEFEKGTVVVMVAKHPTQGAAFVYDLRQDPSDFINLTPAELSKKWTDRSDEAAYFPIKKLTYNKCPTVAPVSTLDEASQKRLKLNMSAVQKNLSALMSAKDFGDKVIQADEHSWPKQQPSLMVDEQQVDELLYDGFVDDSDRSRMSAIRVMTTDKVADFKPDFKDERLKVLWPLYKARQFSESLNPEEKKWWQAFRQQKLINSGWLERYQKRIAELLKSSSTAGKQNLLKELRDYGQVIAPKI